MMEFLLSKLPASAGVAPHEAAAPRSETQTAHGEAQAARGEPTTTRAEPAGDHPNRLERILHCLVEEHARHHAEGGQTASDGGASALAGEKTFPRSPASPAS